MPLHGGQRIYFRPKWWMMWSDQHSYPQSRLVVSPPTSNPYTLFQVRQKGFHKIPVFLSGDESVVVDRYKEFSSCSCILDIILKKQHVIFSIWIQPLEGKSQSCLYSTYLTLNLTRVKSCSEPLTNLRRWPKGLRGSLNKNKHTAVHWFLEWSDMFVSNVHLWVSLILSSRYRTLQVLTRSRSDNL